MSGGSLDYVYTRVEEAADRITPDTALRRAFIKHLKLVSQALYEIEWAQSGDTSPGNEDELKAIRACLHPGAPIATLIDEAKEWQKQIRAEVSRAMSALSD